MYILNLETSTKNCSVALAENGKTVAIREMSEEGYSHAEFLHVFIEEVLSEANITFKDLSAVAVGQGPGSYTGLRIGVSAAKGLCYALDIPLISINTLLTMAKNVTVPVGLIVPMIDARRMEVYTVVYDKNYNIIEAISAKILDENSFNNISEKIYIVGDCQDKVKTTLTDSKFTFLENHKYPTAATMSDMSYDKFLRQDFEDVAYFEPLYLKDFWSPAMVKTKQY